MNLATQVSIPSLVRVKSGTIDRLGAYLFDETGFWDQIKSDPFSLAEWKAALQLAPSIKDDFYTILSQKGALAKAETILENDPRLAGCFVG